MTLIAIDPGSVSGAFAARTVMGDFIVGDLPVVDKQIDAGALAQFITLMDPVAAVVERVGAMPKQGVSSTFKFGKAVGIILGVLAAEGVPVYEVTPGVWKRHFSLGPDKEKARALATKRHPRVEGLSLKKHHGRAEALLLLDYHIETGENR